jgi:hypothetical protein
MKKIFLLLFSLTMIISISAQNFEIVEGDITSDRTLTSDKIYMLRSFVRVQSGAVLTIQPGTFIVGENTTQGTLIIKPGGKIMAEGLVNAPIVFTSEFALQGSTTLPSYGDWGGIIILGNAPINVPGGTAAIEGPGDLYGGNNPDDNSGILKYVRIEYSGIAFSLNNEINGLTLGGVGRGTILEYIQVSYCGDDSFEFFGGNVNAKYLIAYRGWDDDFDTDFGYTGKLQFLVGLRDPEIADQSSSNGFESDNDGSGSLNQPVTSPTWWNVSLFGPLADGSTNINSLYRRGMHLRRSSLNKISNALIMGWPTGIRLDGVNTIQGAVNNNMWINNSIVAGWNSASMDTVSSGNLNFNIDNWFTNSGGRKFVNNSEVMISDPFNLLSPNFIPLAGSPALTGAASPPADGFFDTSADFVGAFGTEDWTAGWAEFNPINYITNVNEPGSFIPEYSLEQNYPNPFNPSTRIKFSLAEGSEIRLSVYNILGEEIAVLLNEYLNAGSYEKSFNAAGLASGIYFYKLSSGSQNLVRKMSVLK